MRIHAEKFGGSSFKVRQDYRRLARRYRELLRKDPSARWVVVVSAFPGLTEEFRGMAHEVNPHPTFESIDALLPMADAISAVLLRHACDAEGVAATTLLGHQHGITTDANFSRARIESLDPRPLRAALATHSLVIIPGGPAVDGAGRPTWLGKNSSDLTVVALASMLGLSECAIYSDVDGVYTSDPNIIAEARPIDRLSYAMAIAMSENGAKVIHHKAVRLAQQSGVKIQCRLNRPPYRAGTLIGESGHLSAVVPDARSQVFQLATDHQCHCARDILRDLEIPAQIVAGKAGFYCVVPGGFVQLEPIFRKHGLQFDSSDKKLLTTVYADGQVHHDMVVSDELVAQAALAHKALEQSRPFSSQSAPTVGGPSQ